MSNDNSGQYWQPLTTGCNLPLSRPNPSVSNSGLVIVQVEDKEVYQPPPVVNWSAAASSETTAQEQTNMAAPVINLTTGTNTGSSAAHQLIHGLPPGMPSPAQPLNQVNSLLFH